MSGSCQMFCCPWTVSAGLTPVKPTSDISTLSQLSVSSQWRPCRPTLFHLSTPRLPPHSVWGECVLACHTLIQSAVEEGVVGGGIQFSKWHNVLLRRMVRLLSVSSSRKALQLCHSGVACSRSTLYLSLPAFLLFWSGKHMRDSNLHFNYIA